MQRKNYFRFALIVLLLAAGLIALRSSGAASENETCCKKSETPCPEMPPAKASPAQIWESLPGQFFSSVVLFR